MSLSKKAETQPPLFLYSFLLLEDLKLKIDLVHYDNIMIVYGGYNVKKL
jgi:hypothetical protein